MDPVLAFVLTIELARTKHMEPEFRSKVLTVYTEVARAVRPDGIVPYLFDGDRSRGEQLDLWAVGRKKLGDGSWIVTDPSKVLTYKIDGPHVRGIAADIYFRKLADGPLVIYPCPRKRVFNPVIWDAYQLLGIVAEKFGLCWGGRYRDKNGNPWPDVYHVEECYYRPPPVPLIYN